MNLEIIPTTFLTAYLEQVPKDLQANFEALHEADISTANFSFYTSVASVFRSKIEGEYIELESYIKHKADGKIEYVAALPYEVEKEMTSLYQDITVLIQQNLSIQEVFYFASTFAKQRLLSTLTSSRHSNTDLQHFR